MMGCDCVCMQGELYGLKSGERAQTIYPRDNLSHPKGIEDSTTSSGDTYVGWSNERTQAIKPKDQLVKPQGEFGNSTTTVSAVCYVSRITHLDLYSIIIVFFLCQVLYCYFYFLFLFLLFFSR